MQLRTAEVLCFRPPRRGPAAPLGVASSNGASTFELDARGATRRSGSWEGPNFFYQYVGNRPTVAGDPDGRAAFPLITPR
jgi:hypothetical protein